MIKAVFFDAIDTLFCAYPNKIEMYRRIIKKHTGMEIDEDKMTAVWNRLVENNEEAAAEELGEKSHQAWDNFNGKILEELGYNGNCREMGERLLHEAWGNADNFVLYKDVNPTLHTLKKEGLSLACVSNENEYLNKFFIHFGIEDYFDFVLTSEEVGYEKPNPKIFYSALNKALLSPNEVLFIGDSLISDYHGAKNVGINPLLIDRENRVEEPGINKIRILTDVKYFIE